MSNIFNKYLFFKKKNNFIPLIIFYENNNVELYIFGYYTSLIETDIAWQIIEKKYNFYYHNFPKNDLNKFYYRIMKKDFIPIDNIIQAKELQKKLIFNIQIISWLKESGFIVKNFKDLL